MIGRKWRIGPGAAVGVVLLGAILVGMADEWEKEAKNVFGDFTPRKSEVVSGKTRVIDADTLDVDGTRVRLRGIDGVERNQTCQDNAGTDWPCGQLAFEDVDMAFGGEDVRCFVQDNPDSRAVADCEIAGIASTIGLSARDGPWPTPATVGTLNRPKPKPVPRKPGSSPGRSSRQRNGGTSRNKERGGHLPASMLSAIRQGRAGIGVRRTIANAVLLETACEAGKPGTVQGAARDKAAQPTRQNAAGMSCKIDAQIKVHGLIRAKE